MAQKIEVVVTRTARNDLGEILEFIRIDSPRTAVKIVTDIYELLRRLPRFPKSGRVILEVGDVSLREIIVGPYRLMYRLEEKKILVLRVLHGKRLFSGEL